MLLLVVQVAAQVQVAALESQVAMAQLVKDLRVAMALINHQDTVQVAAAVRGNLAMLEHLL
jgi:hypothetical protein